MYKLSRLILVGIDVYFYNMHGRPINLVRYDTIVEFNVDSKAEYSAQSSTRSPANQQVSPAL